MVRIMSVETADNLGKSDETVAFYNARRKPFGVYGFCKAAEFMRIPTTVAEKSTVSGGNIADMYKRTSGGRIRFKTNSERIAIRVKIPLLREYSTRPRQMVCGFDLYTNRGFGTEFNACLFPPTNSDDEFERIVTVGAGEKDVTLYFPLMNEVSEVFVGLDKGADVKEAAPYKNEKPIVFLGSSITQGASASRPGLCYANIIERELGTDYVNLGFAGAFIAQEALVDYVSELDMCALVLDYDHNSPSPEHLEKTHYAVYKKVREKNPDIPIILVSKPDYRIDSFRHSQRRTVITDTYSKGIKSGDEKLYFVDGAAFFAGENRADCTDDNIHPNTLGHRKMATHIGETLKYALGLQR